MRKSIIDSWYYLNPYASSPHTIPFHSPFQSTHFPTSLFLLVDLWTPTLITLESFLVLVALSCCAFSKKKMLLHFLVVPVYSCQHMVCRPGAVPFLLNVVFTWFLLCSKYLDCCNTTHKLLACPQHSTAIPYCSSNASANIAIFFLVNDINKYQTKRNHTGQKAFQTGAAFYDQWKHVHVGIFNYIIVLYKGESSGLSHMAQRKVLPCQIWQSFPQSNRLWTT